MASLRLRIDGQIFRDSENREVTIRGINVAGDAKLPASPDVPSHNPEHFFDGDNVSFVGRPFSLEDAHTHFSRLRRWGYNTIRYVFTWEAIEHAGPGKYDEDYIQFTIQLLRVAKEYGFFVFMDPHQDVWSRFSGGSGAPLWTLYACGLNPRRFDVTEAALVHNTYPDPANFPKMIWSTNYTRMVCQVIFTIFFAGKDFAPKARIDDKNIQDYLQDHFIGAVKHLASRISEAGDLLNEVVIGWESMNEPNRGLIGHPDLTKIPEEQKLQKGTSPTAWQAILTGSGRACEEEIWDFGGMGPFKAGSTLVDPKGEQAWLPADYDDTKYGWQRDPQWKLGEDIWAQHGVWDPATDILLKPNYFSRHNKEKVDYEYFTNHWYMDFYRKYRDAIRSVHKEAIMFCQPPVLEIPPSIKGTEDDDANMVYAPHYYDGVTLMTKKWNRWWNVDVFGILRGKYLSPAFAIKVGETAIRNCLREQLSAIRKEGQDYMGNHPCVFTEIGIPYDMDDKYAYKTGDYSSQIAAMDANHFALEGCKANGYTLWVYVADNNTHEWGDAWNGEDLSIYSLDDKLLPTSTATAYDTDPNSPSFSRSNTADPSTNISPANLKSSLSTPSLSSQVTTTTVTSIRKTTSPADLTAAPGFRAAEAYVRPAPITTWGDVISYGFDLRNATFTFALRAPSSTPEPTPTEVFLPEWHFPRDDVRVEVSGGKWAISADGPGGLQRLRWWHGEGDQELTIRGVKRKQGAVIGSGEEELGYLEQCRDRVCPVM